MSALEHLGRLPIGGSMMIGGRKVVRRSLFGFWVDGTPEVLDVTEAAAKAALEDSGGAALPLAARDQTQTGDAGVGAPTCNITGTCARPSPSPAMMASAEGAAEGVRWHAARAEDVHVVLEERVERSNGPGRRSWLREPGQAVCKPRGFRRLERTTAEPTCPRCLREVLERGIALKGAT